MKWLKFSIFITFSLLAIAVDAKFCPHSIDRSFLYSFVCSWGTSDINIGNYIRLQQLRGRKTLEAEKLKNNPTIVPLKNEDYLGSSGTLYQNHATSSKESTPRAIYTTTDNTVVSTIQPSKSIVQIRETDSFTATDNINGNSNSSSGKYDYELNKTSESSIFFASTPTILNASSARTQMVQSTTSTLNKSSSERSTMLKKILHTSIFDSDININVSATEVLATQNNKEIASSSFVDESVTNLVDVSMSNSEVKPSDEALSTESSKSFEMESSSKSTTTHSVIKTDKLVKSAARSTKVDELDVIIEAVSPIQESTNIKSIKLVTSVVFLTVATISIAVLVTYMMKVKRRHMQYDEVILLP